MNNQTTAAEQFDDNAESIRTLLDELAADLGIQNVLFDRTDRRHWGYVGNLAHVRELLEQAHNFLNDKE